MEQEHTQWVYSDEPRMHNKTHLILIKHETKLLTSKQEKLGHLTITFKGHESWPQHNHSNSAYTPETCITIKQSSRKSTSLNIKQSGINKHISEPVFITVFSCLGIHHGKTAKLH